MNEIKKFIDKIVNKEDLSEDESARAMQIIVAGGATPAQIASYITALSTKNIAASEIIGTAKLLKSKNRFHTKYVDFHASGSINSTEEALNISCAVSVILNSIDVTTILTGPINRKFNSIAYILSSWGYNLELNYDQILELLEKTGMAFLPEKYFLPKHADIPFIKNELAFENIFDITQMFTIPIGVRNHSIYIRNKNNIQAILEAAKALELYNVMVICQKESNVWHIAELRNNHEIITGYDVKLDDFDLKEERPLLFSPKNLENNARIIYEHITSVHDDAFSNEILIQASIALFCTKKTTSLIEGCIIAREIIDSGKCSDFIKTMVGFSSDFLLQNTKDHEQIT